MDIHRLFICYALVGFDVRALIAEQCGHAEWGQFAARLLEGFDSPSSPGNMYQKPKYV
jgi:hypothetical protein